jgi:RNA ligase (TIGR02306 family)
MEGTSLSTTTEKICEVVCITKVLPHPNADRLELAHFKTKDGPSAYTCVTAKGQFKVGQVAAYVGVDCVVPLEGDQSERWAFLKKREDVGTERKTHRIRAARLRGVYSEGILMECDIYALGFELWDWWHITEYTPKQKGSAFPSANPNKRIDHTLGGLFPEYSVHSLKKMPFLFAPGELVVLTEKVHGTNMRCGYLPVGFLGRERFVVGSHRCVKTDLRNVLQRLQDWLNRKLNKRTDWYGTDVWTQAAARYDLEHKLKAFPDHVCYFELYGVTAEGKRIQDLTYGDVELGLILLDVYDADTGTWLREDELRLMALRLGIPMKRPLASVVWTNLDDVKPFAEGKSTMDGAEGQIREGFVAHSPTDSRRGKFVGQGYLLRKSADEEQES